MATGKLVVFEGPDGIGKSKLSELTANWLRNMGLQLSTLSFPGNERNTLGSLIYDIHHHHQDRFSIAEIDPLSLQTLHIAAHIDEVRRAIRPAIDAGHWVVLDRFWWSTWVYGVAAGAFQPGLEQVIGAERLYWRDLKPAIIFLVSRSEAIRKEHSKDSYDRLSGLYAEIAEREEQVGMVRRIENEVLEQSFNQVVSVLKPLLEPSSMHR